MRVARLLRIPGIRFAALGLLLFLVRELAPEPEPALRALHIPASRVVRLVERYEEVRGRPARPDEVEALVAREIEEEALYQEALALGLHETDRGVQWRLIEKMTFLSGTSEGESDRVALLEEARELELGHRDPIVRRILVEQMKLRMKHAGSRRTPGDAELEAWLALHRDDFRRMGRTRLSQVVLLEGRGPTLHEDATALRKELAKPPTSPEDAFGRGDPFPVVGRDWLATDRDLADRLGEGFRDAVAALEPGRWSDPIASPYGLHLVWVHAREPAEDPALERIRSQVLYAYLAERRETALERAVDQLVARYDVQVEWPRRDTS